MARLLVFSLAALCISDAVSASPPLFRTRTTNTSSKTLSSASPSYQSHDKRQGASVMTACGYKDGDPDGPRTAEPGFDCRFDTSNGIWGFCATDIKALTSCGLAGYCVDAHSCSTGCGSLVSRTDITTVTWYVNLKFVREV
jgi:hypothetical protein